MKERPILMSAPMVRAILEGRKTQTRRVVNPQPNRTHDGEPYWFVGGYRAWTFRECDDILRKGGSNLLCPYGNVGDRLWVRETTLRVEEHGYLGPVYLESERGRAFLGEGMASSEDGIAEVEPWEIKKRPSVFMPRAMSRINLEITDVRVERLNDISEDDARAEGVFVPEAGYAQNGRRAPVMAFSALWESINGAGSWALNPWVWCLTFRRTDAAIQRCDRCLVPLVAGIAMGQTVDCSDEGTVSVAGPGHVMPCLKCPKCGHSVRVVTV